MLETVKNYIAELPDTSFDSFYQAYICRVQDQNIYSELASLRTDDIVTIDKLITRLNNELANN